MLTRLNVRPNHQKLKATKESNDFVFELRHGQDLDLQWQKNNRLKIVYEAGADIYRQLNQQDDVEIIYQAKTINALPRVEKQDEPCRPTSGSHSMSNAPLSK